MTNTKLYVGALALIMLVATPLATFAHGGDKRADGTSTEVAITDAGHVLVRGAIVTGISGNSITARTTWDNGTAMTWTIVTDAQTEFLTRAQNSSSLSNIATGNTISFAGEWTSAGNLTVSAFAVKNWSEEAAVAKISGFISAISGSVLELHGEKSIQSSSATHITLDGATSTIRALSVGDKVKAEGVWNDERNILTASVISATDKISLENRYFNSMKDRWFKGKSFLGLRFGW